MDHELITHVSKLWGAHAFAEATGFDMAETIPGKASLDAHRRAGVILAQARDLDAARLDIAENMDRLPDPVGILCAYVVDEEADDGTVTWLFAWRGDLV